MTKAILVRKRDNAVIGTVIDAARPQWIVDPATGKRLASPARVGWENDDYRLCLMREFLVPDGKQLVGERTRTYDDRSNAVIESAIAEDKPGRQELTDIEKLERATGLDIARIKAVLSR
jgi:hypothetical protein